MSQIFAFLCVGATVTDALFVAAGVQVSHIPAMAFALLACVALVCEVVRKAQP